VDLERVVEVWTNGAGRHISPELIEQALGFALEIEDVLKGI
jgi:hypothetical protein